MITAPWFYAAAVPAVLLTGISKGGFAGGLGLMAVPIMALAISPVQAAGIMLPILIAMDAIGVWAYRRNFDADNLKAMVPGAVLGITLGALTFGFVAESAVRLIVGVIAIVFAAVSLWPKQSQALSAPQRRGAASGAFWGTVAGFTSFISHAGGPPFQVHMLPQRLDKTRLVGTSVMFFALVNLIKLPPYALLGQLAPANLSTSLALLPLAPLGMGAGIWLHRLVPERPFYIACYVMILIVGVKLVWDGLAALL
jgi:hypothetical protein